MSLLTFDLLKQAWSILRQKREQDLLRLAPDMTTLQHIYLKLIDDRPTQMTIQFSGLESSVNNTSNVPQVKNLLRDWVTRVSTSVQIKPSDPTSLVLVISKNSNVLETKVEEKINTPTISEHKYERSLDVDRVKIIMKN